MIYEAIAIIFVISFLWAFLSLKSLNKKTDVETIKKKLNKGRVIYQHH